MKILPAEHPEKQVTESVPIFGLVESAPLASERDAMTGEGGIEGVYRSEHERLWKSLLAFTSDPEIASDAEAETFTQALARGSELVDPAAWIWRSAFRIAKGMMADRSSEIGRVLPDQVEMEPPLIELLSMLETLTSQQRAIVVLRYAAGFRPSEIADVLETSPSTVSVQLHRSHGLLRKKL